jgi:DnaJ-class molecular chaperone
MNMYVPLTCPHCLKQIHGSQTPTTSSGGPWEFNKPTLANVWQKCPVCDGAGTVKEISYMNPMATKTCPACNGKRMVVTP